MFKLFMTVSTSRTCLPHWLKSWGPKISLDLGNSSWNNNVTTRSILEAVQELSTVSNGPYHAHHYPELHGNLTHSAKPFPAVFKVKNELWTSILGCSLGWIALYWDQIKLREFETRRTKITEYVFLQLLQYQPVTAPSHMIQKKEREISGSCNGEHKHLNL